VWAGLGAGSGRGKGMLLPGNSGVSLSILSALKNCSTSGASSGGHGNYTQQTENTLFKSAHKHDSTHYIS